VKELRLILAIITGIIVVKLMHIVGKIFAWNPYKHWSWKDWLICLINMGLFYDLWGKIKSKK